MKACVSFVYSAYVAWDDSSRFVCLSPPPPPPPIVCLLALLLGVVVVLFSPNQRPDSLSSGCSVLVVWCVLDLGAASERWRFLTHPPITEHFWFVDVPFLELPLAPPPPANRAGKLRKTCFICVLSVELSDVLTTKTEVFNVVFSR